MLAALAVIGGTLLIGLVFSRTISRPMHELIDRAERIAAATATPSGRSRITAPASSRSCRTASSTWPSNCRGGSDYIATFSTHLTHELKSPLTSIKGAAELLLESLQSKTDNLTRMEQKNFVSNILGDADRLEAMTQRLRELARAENAPQNEQQRTCHSRRRPEEPLPDPRDRRQRLPRSLDRHVRREGADRAVAPHRQRHPPQRQNMRLEAVDDDGAVEMTVSNDGDPISEPTATRSSTPSSPRAATPAAPAWALRSCGHHDQPWRIDPAAAVRPGRRFELLFPAA